MQKLVPHLQAALRSGPIGSEELAAFLEQRGLRWVEAGDIYLACTEHGLADLSPDGRWIPRGWAVAAESSSDKSKPDVNDSAPTEDSRESQAPLRVEEEALSGVHRVEIAHLRAQLVLARPPIRRPAGQAEVPREWTEFLDEASAGLRDELSAVTRRRTLHDIPLRSGSVRERGVSRQVVRYEADAEPTVKDGMAATLILGSDAYEAEVISTFGVIVTLAVPLQAPIGERATLRCDLTYLISYQSGRLRELRTPDQDFNVRAALEVVRPSAHEPERAEPYWIGNLNEQQSQAVGQALTDATTWIWGPPGTGKTTTLAALLAELYAGGRRIWLTAPTNMAVDIALSAALGQIKDYDVGSIVRVGQPALAELRHRHPPVLANELVDLRSAALEQPQAEASVDLERLRKRLKELSRDEGDSREMRDIELRIGEQQSRLRELERLRCDVRRDVISRARFVAATTQQALLAALKGQTFDVVVIDEASMLPASLAALAAGAGRGHTVVAGDFRQLPPVVVSDSGPARRWLGRSAFEAAGIDRRVLNRDPPNSLVALKLQHRMPPALADAVSAGFYRENPLETAASVLERQELTDLSRSRSIVCVDTSALRPRLTRRGGVHSRYNLMHALLVAALLEKSDLAGPAPALISPFAPQARLLESLLGESGDTGEASTVHRFQGGERNVVVVDAVESAGGALKLHPWFAEGDDGTDGARLVNVAASRARERLILVADFARVHRSRNRDDALSRFFRAVQSGADFVAPADVLSSEQLFRQLDLSVFRSDVNSAERRIEIWSRLVDLGPMLLLTKPLLAAVGRGVEVTLWFEPDGHADVPRPLEPLRASEVLLRPCSPVRESSAVVDDTVWAASGPLLSARTGYTLRRKHKPLADALTRMTKRRESGGSTASGEAAGRCGTCDRLLVRLESYQTRANCLRCDARRSARPSRQPWRT